MTKAEQETLRALHEAVDCLTDLHALIEQLTKIVEVGIRRQDNLEAWVEMKIAEIGRSRQIH